MSEHPGLRMEPAQVWNSLRLVDQLDELGHDVGNQLTMTAHRALFRIEDKSAKKQLAQTAAAEGWTAKRVADTVRGLVTPTSGRPRDQPMEALIKKIERAARPLGDPDAVAGFVEGEASPDELLRWAARLEQQAMVLEGVAVRMRRRLVRS